MKTSTEMRAGVGILVTLQLLTTIGAVALLERMRPAIGDILTDNVSSIHAVEDMLAAVALAPESGSSLVAFDQALGRAERNITEARERPLLAEVRRLRDPALAGDGRARGELVRLLQELAAVNRASMREADHRAQQLGLGGAWAMALLGIVAFVVALLVIRRLRVHILRPLRRLYAVADEASSGHTYRRYHGGGASDLVAIGRALNQLIDRRQHPTGQPEAR